MANGRPEPVFVATLDRIEDEEAPLLTAFAAVRDVREGRTRAGRPYVDLELADQTRSVAGKIWDDAGAAIQTAAGLRRGAVVKLLFRSEHYQGALQLNVRGIRTLTEREPGYDAGRVFGAGYPKVADSLCANLVFDIETVPATELATAPETIRKAVHRHAERQGGDEDMVMGLSPMLGKVVSLAYGEADAETDDGVRVLVVPPPEHDEAQRAAYPPWMQPVSEPELLEAFWALAAHAGVVITYNGRTFDVPFLVGRSLVHGIPARVDLLGNPYALRPHLDLYRVLTQGRPLGPMTLDMVCWSLGITSPKDEMDGSQVAPAYARGDIEMIATYNRKDVVATAAVFRRVREQVLRFRDDW
ncbi:MAG: ribonuclease H-like domain-containing protein [Myxococcales bacterium]|nr:ribonuclease H-like domain-containing protein [Myxococcales bacterium]